MRLSCTISQSWPFGLTNTEAQATMTYVVFSLPAKITSPRLVILPPRIAGKILPKTQPSRHVSSRG